MKRLFWNALAPLMILIMAVGGILFVVHPHCFVNLKYKAVMTGGIPVQGAACFTSSAAETELILIPGENESDYLVYSVDVQGEVAGLLDKREILAKLPGVLLVRNPSVYGKLIEREIYDPHEIGHDPNQYHFTAGNARRIDVLYVPGKTKHELPWTRIILALLRDVFIAVMLLGAPLFITVGWLALRRNGDASWGRHRRVAFLIAILATLDWLVLAVAVRANLFFPSFRGIETWAGMVVSTACVLASIVGTGNFRRPMTYLSVALMLTWLVVASFPV